MLFVQIKDATGRILCRDEGPREELRDLQAKAKDAVTKHIMSRVLKSLPDDIKQPLTVEWGEEDG